MTSSKTEEISTTKPASFNNLSPQFILTQSAIAQPLPQKQLPHVLTQTFQPTQTPTNTTSIFIVKLHNNKAIYQPTTTNNQTVRILLDQYTKTHHKLPPSCRLSFANKPVCLDTPLSYYYNKYSMPIFDIILPILGGMNHVNTTILQFPPQ